MHVLQKGIPNLTFRQLTTCYETHGANAAFWFFYFLIFYFSIYSVCIEKCTTTTTKKKREFFVRFVNSKNIVNPHTSYYNYERMMNSLGNFFAMK